MKSQEAGKGGQVYQLGLLPIAQLDISRVVVVVE